MTKTWWEAPMGGSVLSFLKAEWKVSEVLVSCPKGQVKKYVNVEACTTTKEYLTEVPFQPVHTIILEYLVSCASF
jgi:hypothetical protein